MFKSARLKLTAWYLVMIMAVSVAFSLVIYEVQVAELDRFVEAQRFRIERRAFLAPPPIFDPDLVVEAKQRLEIFLIGINAVILVVAGGVGYFLAGRTLRPIQEMVDEQNQFVGDASHELRTPLAALKSAFEVNQRDRKLTVSGAKELMTEGIAEVDKLQALSDKLLRLAQYQEHNGKKKMEIVELGGVLSEAIRKVKPMADRKKITIENPESGGRVKGDREGLVDLVVILLDNAIKYSAEEKTVMVGAKKTDGAVILTVRDRGAGISPKDLPHIFDRFYRADSARVKEGTGGYGLGLAIAKKIAAENGGTISAVSRVGVGSTFQVVFRNGA